MSTAMSTLTQCSIGAFLQWQAGLTVAGFQPRVDPENFNKKIAYSLGSSAGSVNEIYSSLLTVTHASSTSLDLTALTDVVGVAITFSAVKGIFIWLLATTDTAPDQTTVGNASSSITIDNTVTNALSAQSHSGWFDNAAEGAANGSKFTIPNGGFMLWGCSNAGGITVDGTHKIIKIAANDGAVDAKVLVSILGNG